MLVDTSVLSLLKLDTRAERYRGHLEGTTPGISFMTVAEVCFRAEKYGWGARRRAHVDKTLHTYVVVPCDDALCVSWAKIRRICEQKGRRISVADAWVGACALRFDAPLVTHNRKDFEAVPDLHIIAENA
ncbi:MAG: PIN domain-containing protein [Thermomicrobia bacterium]|nr:PIN domain-containing protein [Thermomicrobia bacterium]MCA1725015.1 PIN domain-containing protein [Thermomicrobia bacterium]